jgi:ADP-ribose pyrophosphatase
MKIIPKKIKEIFKSKHLTFFDIEYVTKSGTTSNWELVSRGDYQRLHEEIFYNTSFSDGAMIVATNDQKDRLIMLKEYRIGAGRYMYSFPAGLVSSNDEDIKNVAIREFKEETGLELIIEKEIRPMYSSIGLSNEKISIVFGTFSGNISKEYQEDTEEAEIFEVDEKMARHILLDLREVDIRSAMLLDTFFNIGYFSI